jgi:hypothetical protein
VDFLFDNKSLIYNCWIWWGECIIKKSKLYGKISSLFIREEKEWSIDITLLEGCCGRRRREVGIVCRSDPDSFFKCDHVEHMLSSPNAQYLRLKRAPNIPNTIDCQYLIECLGIV